jgi:hypothetical protein
MARHPADLLSLSFGLLFVAVALVLFSGGIETFSLEWVAPLAAIILGAVLILVARPSAPSDDLPTQD